MINLLFASLALIFIPLYPKFPFLSVSGSFVSVRLEDFLILILVVYFFIVAARQRFRDATSPLNRSILVFLLVGAVATFSGIFLTKTASLPLGVLHYFRRVEYLSLFFVGFYALSHLSQLHYLLRVVLFIALLVSLYGLGQQYLGFPVISTTNSEFAKGLALTLGPGARINSTFAGHYDLAAFCLFPLLLIIAVLPYSRHRWPLLLVGGLVYWTLLLSASRITFASFFASASLLVLLLGRKYWLIPLAVLAMVGFALSPQLRGRYLEFITNHLSSSYVTSVSAQEETKDVNEVPDALKPSAVAEDRSFNIRFQAEWPRAIRSVIKNPILGTGYSSVGLAIDNDYLRTAAETGLLGLAAFLTIFILYFAKAISTLYHQQSDFTSSFLIAVLCSNIGILLNAVFIDVFAASKIAIITWLMLGFSYKALLLISDEKIS